MKIRKFIGTAWLILMVPLASCSATNPSTPEGSQSVTVAYQREGDSQPTSVTVPISNVGCTHHFGGFGGSEFRRDKPQFPRFSNFIALDHDPLGYSTTVNIDDKLVAFSSSAFEFDDRKFVLENIEAQLYEMKNETLVLSSDNATLIGTATISGTVVCEKTS